MGCEMGKIKVVTSKPVSLGQLILALSRLVIYEFHYDYMVTKYGDKLTLCYADIYYLISHIETEDFYYDISENVDESFNTSDFTETRPLPMGKNKKVIGLMKDELGGQIMTKFVEIKPEFFGYQVINGLEDKKCKGIKKSVRS